MLTADRPQGRVCLLPVPATLHPKVGPSQQTSDITLFSTDISSDLLNAHLRRHEKRGHSASTPSQIDPVEPSMAMHAHHSSPSDASPSDSHAPEHLERQDYAPVQPILGQYAPAMGLPHPHLVPPGHGHGNGQGHEHARTHAHAHDLSPSEAIPHNSNSSGVTHNLAQQQFFPPMADDDSTWLFPGTSLFDLPPDDYLNLHFGGALGPASPVRISILYLDSC